VYVANDHRRRIYRGARLHLVNLYQREGVGDMGLGTYGRLATEVYDITKPIGHSFGDVEHYLQRLKSCTGRVLEPAVPFMPWI